MSKKVKVALVGCGYWGGNLLRNLANHPNTVLTAFCDSQPARLAKAAEIYTSAKPYQSFDAMLAEQRPEAALIATPPDSHAKLAVKALQAGAHVLIEKPMAKSSSECDFILREAMKAGRKVMIDNTLLFYPPFVYVMDLIRKGGIGKLLYYDSVRVNLGGFQSQANVLWDLAPHEFSVLDLITGNQTPQEIIAVGNKHYGSTTESICYLNLKYADNFNAHLHLNWAAPVKTRRLTIAGDQKMVEIDDGVPMDKVRIHDKSVKMHHRGPEGVEFTYHSGEITVPAIPVKEALAEMLTEFTASITENREPSSNGLSGARVVRMLEAATASLEKTGQPTRVAA